MTDASTFSGLAVSSSGRRPAVYAEAREVGFRARVARNGDSPAVQNALERLDKALASGSSPAPAARAPTAGTGTRDFSLLWDTEEGKDRKLLSDPEPLLPRRVQEDGLTLTMELKITVEPSGIVSKVTTSRSSGYADVDAAVLAAVRRWRFSPAETTRVMTGSIKPYTIRPR